MILKLRNLFLYKYVVIVFVDRSRLASNYIYDKNCGEKILVAQFTQFSKTFNMGLKMRFLEKSNGLVFFFNCKTIYLKKGFTKETLWKLNVKLDQ